MKEYEGFITICVPIIAANEEQAQFLLSNNVEALSHTFPAANVMELALCQKEIDNDEHELP